MNATKSTNNSFHKQQAQIQHTRLGRIEYLDSGSGPVVVAIHGALGGYDQSAILAETVLSGNFRVLAISRPGYLNTPIRSGVSPAEQADLVAALLDELKIERAIVIAISGGGPCAISLALRHPLRCRALVLISTVSGINTVKIPFSFKIFKLMARLSFLVSAMRKKTFADLEQTAARSVTNAVLRQEMLADEHSRELFVALTASTFERTANRIAGTENDIRITQTTLYPLEDIKLPTLIIHGDKDPLVDYQVHAVAAQKRIANAELLTLEGGEHAAIFTHRQRVQDNIARFITAL